MGLVAVALLLGVPCGGSASGQESARQTLSFTFDAQQPASSTGLQLAIDYVNPDDPTAKPFAVQTVVERLAAGASIDTSVPTRCTAEDAALTTQGAAACPADSVVGGGEVDLDSGLPGPLRTIHNTVIQFNNADELVLLFEPEAGSGLLRSVARAPITEGGTVITAQAPPLPGGPPDGFTALKRVRLELRQRAVVRDGISHAYITTPASCPPSERWANTVTFTYRDGVTQTLTSDTPCVVPAPPVAEGITPIASASPSSLALTGDLRPWTLGGATLLTASLILRGWGRMKTGRSG
jgi:hypothetical protein